MELGQENRKCWEESSQLKEKTDKLSDGSELGVEISTNIYMMLMMEKLGISLAICLFKNCKMEVCAMNNF